ncbi:50S ribosomal protein L9 [Candidatus Poribacteria bacterium]|nr:50S ribosomal protein L9 [Candidatus Poribacteria bacterium]
MEVILTETISGLGREGDIVKVSDGYARNFLIPKQLAVEAIAKNRRLLEHKSRQKINQDARQRKEAEKLASELANLSCTIPMRAGETDRLFGSVTAMDIAKALKEQGFEVDRRKIELLEPIKELGAFTVPIRIHADVVANVRVLVIRETS